MPRAGKVAINASTLVEGTSIKDNCVDGRLNRKTIYRLIVIIALDDYTIMSEATKEINVDILTQVHSKPHDQVCHGWGGGLGAGAAG